MTRVDACLRTARDAKEDKRALKIERKLMHVCAQLWKKPKA